MQVIGKANELIGANRKVRQTIWSKISGMSKFITAFYNLQATPDTIVKLAYGNESLFIQITGHTDGGKRAETEYVFVILQTHTGNETFYSIPLVVNEGPNPIEIIYNNIEDAKDCQQKIVDLNKNQVVDPKIVRYLDGSWTAEITVPLKELESSSHNSGENWGINVLRYFGINSPRVLSSFAPLKTSQFRDADYDNSKNRKYDLQVYLSNEGRFNRFYFDHLPLHTETNKLAVVWTPEVSPQLFYQSFTNKKIVFPGDDMGYNSSIHMVWNSPLGKSTVIKAGNQEFKDDTWNICFTHPEAKEEGLYRLIITLAQPDENIVKQVQLSFDRHNLIEAGDKKYSPAPTKEKVKQIKHEPISDKVKKLIDLIPNKVGLIGNRCAPHNPSVKDRKRKYTWDPANPWVMISNDEQKIQYPNNKYPEDKSFTVVNRLGVEVDYPYYEDKNGYRYLLSAQLWYFQCNHVKSQIEALAYTDPLGAARVLYRFAEVYPGWVPVTDHNNWAQYPIAPSSGPPYSYFGGMWRHWSIMELEGLKRLMGAYETVRQTNAFELLSQEVKEDVNLKIVEDMFIPSVQFVLMFSDNKFNMNAHNYSGFAQMARISRDPKYMHLAMEKLDIYLESMFMLDGFWKEVTVSYHSEVVELVMNTIHNAIGWTDPLNYESSRTGKRFQDLDPIQHFPALKKMKKIKGELTYPDGSYLPVNETSAYHKVPITERQYTDSLLKSAAGIVKLAKGNKELQSQLYLMFTSNYGYHHHYSPLNLVLYAKGQELLPDIGYTHTKYRKWTTSTLSHNTVVINGKDSTEEGEAIKGGNLTKFIKMGDDIEVVCAEQKSAYPELSEYSREPWFVGFNGLEDEQVYILDIFRVAGGERHEYTLNGDANRRAFFETDLELEDYGPFLLAGNPNIKEPVDEYDTGSISGGQHHGYMHIHDVRYAPVQCGRYELTLRTYEEEQGKAGLKVVGFVNPGNNELFLGKSPSLKELRTKGLSFDTNEDGAKHFMPKMVLRREGTDLKSNFVTIMEPLNYREEPKIKEVNVLKSNLVTGEVVVTVMYYNIQDIMLSAPNYKDEPLVFEDLRLEGKMGFIRIVDGEIYQMYLSDGTLLKKGNRKIMGNGPVSGWIKDTLRKKKGDPYDALLTDVLIPDSVVGRYVVVIHPDHTTTGYKIAKIKNQKQNTIMVLEDQDPGFEINKDGSSELKHFPRTSWNGKHKFKIANIEILDRKIQDINIFNIEV